MAGPLTRHLSEETLLAHAEGKLDSIPAGSVKGHLERCPDCARRLAELLALDVLGSPGSAHASGGRAPAPISPTESAGIAIPSGTFAAPPRVTNLPAGLDELDDYEILGELGSGGPVQTFLANNRLMGRHEVLKVLGHSITERPELLGQYMKEIGAVARLQHPNIVISYSAFHSGDTVIFPMEYAEGHDLARLVKARGPLPISRACYYAHQAAQALRAASAQGLVHRDIKPGHLVVSRNPERPVIKILDFGIAKVAVETGAIDRWRGNSVNDRAGKGDQGAECSIPGTPAFIAPEQIADPQRADIRADIYSLGCTLYYLLSGREPFMTAKVSEAFQAHHSIDHRPLNLVRPQVPFELAALVAKMMAKEPERRFQTPDDVATALAPYFSKGTAHAQAASFARCQDDPPSSQPTASEPPGSGNGERLGPFASSTQGPEEASGPPGETPNRSTFDRIHRLRGWPLGLLGAGFAATLLGAVVLSVPRNPPTHKGASQLRHQPEPTPSTPPSPTPTREPSPTPKPTQTPEPTPTPKSTSTPEPTPAPKPTPRLTQTPEPPKPPEWQWKDTQYVLQAEQLVFDAFEQCKLRRSQYVHARTALLDVINRREIALTSLAALKLQLEELSEQDAYLSAGLEDLRNTYRQKRDQYEQLRAVNYGFGGLQQGLSHEISQLVADQNQVTQQINTTRVKQPELKKQIQQWSQVAANLANYGTYLASLEQSRAAYLESLRALRNRVNEVQGLYERHSNDPEVLAEVDRKNSIECPGRTLYFAGSSPGLKNIVNKLTLHENWARRVEPSGTQKKGKSARASVGGLPPEF